MTTVHQLDAFVVEHRYTGRHDRDEAEPAAVRAVRAPLRYCSATCGNRLAVAAYRARRR